MLLWSIIDGAIFWNASWVKCYPPVEKTLPLRLKAITIARLLIISEHNQINLRINHTNISHSLLKYDGFSQDSPFKNLRAIFGLFWRPYEWILENPNPVIEFCNIQNTDWQQFQMEKGCNILVHNNHK